MLFSIAAALNHRPQQIQGQELIGVVVKNVHPEGKHGLIQVRIRDLHEGWADEDLPWMKARQGYGSGDPQITDVKIPAVGTKVYTRAEDRSQYHMTYREGPPSQDKHNKEFINKDYPWIYGTEDTAGNLEKQNTKEGKNEYTYHHQSGTKIHIDNDGNVTINSAKDLTYSAKETLHLKAKNVKLDATEKVDMRSKDDFEVHVQDKGTYRLRIDKPWRETLPPLVGPEPEAPGNPNDTQARKRPNPKMNVNMPASGT